MNHSVCEQVQQQQLLIEQLRGVKENASDHWRPVFHLSPPMGLLNDPNGLVYHLGRYHMFYQWNPLACAHGAKFWGHVSSSNLVDWQHHPVTLAPAQSYESHGCYSGSAVSDGEKLWLFYTGNVKLDDGGRESWQCLAEVVEDQVIKHGPLFGIPAGYTRHIRDPKVWRQGGRWSMVLGAQNVEEQGRALLYRSDDKHSWTFNGELAGSHLGGLGDFGYMWECPDLFNLQGQDFLIVCPQGLAAEEERYQNVYQCGYFSSRVFNKDGDKDEGRFIHGEFTELDNGFEFYAPQTFTDANSSGKGQRRLLIGWMGVPDQDEFSQPTIDHNWLHIMTVPRELVNVAGKIQQRVPLELMLLRSEILLDGRFAGIVQVAEACEWTMQVCDQPFTLIWRNCAELVWDGSRFLFRRLSWATGQWQERVVRPERLDSVRIFHDHSSLEIFINGGESVLSGRIFPDADALTVNLHTAEPMAIKAWRMRAGFPSPVAAARASCPALV